MSGPLFCVRTDVGAEGAGTQIWPQNFFPPIIPPPPPPPHLSSQNDERNVGIVLSHRCWVAPPPPPPGHGRSGTPALNLPSRHSGQGGGGVGKMGFLVFTTPPPPPAEQFSSHPVPLPRPRLHVAHADVIARASSCTLWLMVVLGGNCRLSLAGEVHVLGVAPLCLCHSGH